jgi:hypothetical protein
MDGRNWARFTGGMDAAIELVHECMDDYDVDGWTRGPWL